MKKYTKAFSTMPGTGIKYHVFNTWYTIVLTMLTEA